LRQIFGQLYTHILVDDKPTCNADEFLQSSHMMPRDEINARHHDVAVASTLLYLTARVIPGLRFDKDYQQVADGGRNRPLLALN
jgi:hypothetical protein